MGKPWRAVQGGGVIHGPDPHPAFLLYLYLYL